MKSLYFDHAATSWPKAPGVAEAMSQTLSGVAASPARGQHRAVNEANQLLAALRQQVANLFHLSSPSHAIFTHNCTDALNMAIHAVLAKSSTSSPAHVITSSIEHNAIRRPLAYLAEQGAIEVTLIEADAHGTLRSNAVANALRKETQLVALQHASNVTGQLHEIEKIGGLLRDAQAFFLVDAAQTAGHVPIDVNAWGIDLLACSGHKGLLGPAGTGLMCLANKAIAWLDGLTPWRVGGSGYDSTSLMQPAALPEKFEAGTLNLPGLAGLGAALEAWRQHGEIWRSTMHANGERLLRGLQAIEGLKLYGHHAEAACASLPIFSFTIAGYEPEEVAAILDSSFQIATRSGHHCNPGMHETLGTLVGGTVRVSAGPFVDSQAIDALLHALAQLLS